VAFLITKIIATDKTIKQIVILEIERIENLIDLKATNVDEINLNHIDVTNVTNMNELFKDMTLSKPLNIEEWNFKNIINTIEMFNSSIEKTNPEMWRV
jgi:ABC-type lipoprotein release transport system permease subunit